MALTVSYIKYHNFFPWADVVLCWAAYLLYKTDNFIVPTLMHEYLKLYPKSEFQVQLLDSVCIPQPLFNNTR